MRPVAAVQGIEISSRSVCVRVQLRTVNVHATTVRRDTPNTEKAAHSQSEPWVERWKVAFGGLRSSAELPIVEVGD